MNILIVDDSHAIRSDMENIIKETNHTLFKAKDGAEGLAELATKDFDIVIADLNLPRLDGLTMIAFYLKIRDQGVKKIMLTGMEITPELRDKGLAIGIDAWMQKPLKEKVVIKALDDIQKIIANE